MKKLALAALVAAFTAGPALADTIENGYGNTFVVTNAAGETANYYLDADHNFHAVQGEAHLAGTWEVRDGNLCFTGADGSGPNCSPYVGDKNVGDTWTQATSDGSEITVNLRAGR